MYLTTAEDIERLKRDGYDVWTISCWEQWFEQSAEFFLLIDEFKSAFEDVELEDGIGMLEADAIDSHASYEERTHRREEDNRNRWQAITSEELNQNYCSFGYCDAKGGRFLLPAYLLCDLRDEYIVDFAPRVIEMLASVRRPAPPWLSILDGRQAEALVGIIKILKLHPDYMSRHEQIDLAVTALNQQIAGDNLE